jgi:hypothetical protein
MKKYVIIIVAILVIIIIGVSLFIFRLPGPISNFVDGVKYIKIENDADKTLTYQIKNNGSGSEYNIAMTIEAYGDIYVNGTDAYDNILHEIEFIPEIKGNELYTGVIKNSWTADPFDYSQIRFNIKFEYGSQRDEYKTGSIDWPGILVYRANNVFIGEWNTYAESTI